MIYKNIEITRSLCNGLYIAFIINKGYFKSNTLKGIKNTINMELVKC